MQDGYAALDAQIQAFRDSDAQRDQLLEHLIQRLREVEQKHGVLARDYENERMFRHHWQEKHDGLDEELTTMRQSVENNCFVQVLIDGDASYFYENRIKEGEKGGETVAAELHAAIRDHLDTLFPGTDLPIILNMYANLGGLSGLYVRNGIIPSPSGLFVFARGFNSGQDMFHLVDVGNNKEGADHKIREMLRTFLNNKHCKHVIFAGCHDNGYLNTLRPLAHDPEKRQRITLLETLPAEPGFKKLEYNMTNFPSIFKSETPKMAPPSTFKPAQPQVLPIRSPSPADASSGASGTWSATAASNGAGVIDVSATKTKPMKHYLLNAERFRVDDKLPPVPTAAVQSVRKKREEEGPLCNEFYLRGHCFAGDDCSYLHKLKLSTAEFNALRSMARNLSCGNLSFCEDASCYKGHVCPYASKGRMCTKQDDCYFWETHNMDFIPAIKVYENGKEEKLH